MKRYSFFLTLATMLVLSFGLANGQNDVYLSGASTGYSGPDTVATGRAVVWTFAFRNNSGSELIASNNGFVLYSLPESSVTWAPIFLDTLDISGTGAGWKTRYDFGVFIYPDSTLAIPPPPTTGMGRDTVGIGGFNNSGPGFENGFDASVVTVTIPAPGIPDQFDGGTICIDSTVYDPNAQNAWLWGLTGGGSAIPAWDGPHCYTIFKVPDIPAVITNCQATLDFDHCVMAMYDFDAQDQDTIGGPPTFALLNGPGSIDAGTGVWSYSPSLADVGTSQSIEVTTFSATQGASCIVALSFTNVAPSFTDGCNVTIPIGKGNPLNFDFDAVSNDCDPISYSISGVGPTEPVGSYSINASTGLVTFNTDDADGDKQFVFTVCVTDGNATVCCETTIDVLVTEPYEVAIEKTHRTAQGGHELVCVTLDKGSEQMWGFDFLIAYDASALSFQIALEGADLYANGCGWEYFNYRYGASGNCGNACPSGQLRVVGIAETNNGATHPACYKPDQLPAEMFCLDFLVTADQTFECQYVPIRFYWYDCGDNTISFNPSEDITGFEQRLAISRAVIDFDLVGDVSNPNVGYPTAQGAQDADCFPADADPEKPAPVRFIDFINGGIDIVCVDDIDDRGDINLNNVANEVADAVLFTNYFIYGIGVFTINIQGQIAATDVNADGLTLSVADLVYL
ncbi:MAG: hypothetical protein IID63_08465, partial [candidate division Zixibacteria bacterium]|nr:hypothetical protein [candidate division Zixibacteria bacterium]